MAEADALPLITDEEVELAAATVGASPRSVIRVLAGLPVRGLAGERARIAAAALRQRVQ